MSELVKHPHNLTFRGTQEAFAVLVRQYQNLVYATIFSILGNPQQSEDVAQETFLLAWKNYGTLENEEKLSSWLCGIARNLSRKWLRENDKSRESLTDFAVSPPAFSETVTFGEQPSREDAAHLVWDSLKHLPEKYREPLVMFYQNQTPVREIADALELSEELVKQRLSRGRRQLKKIVEQQFSAALEVLKPRESFCLAVIAAIPLAAGTTNALAAAGAVVLGKSTAAGTTATTTPATGGSTVVALGMSTTLLVVNAVLWIAFYVGLFFGINRVLQNSPTLRSRRLMIQIVLWHYAVIYVALCLIPILFSKYMTTEPALKNDFVNITFSVGAVCLIGYTSMTCWYFNKKWRQIVEEDMGIRPKPDVELEQSFLSRRSLRCQIGGIFGLIGICVIGHFLWNLIMGNFAVHLGSFILRLIPHLVLLFIVISMYRSTKDEETFQKYPSRCPDILDELTGKCDRKRRSCFLIDLCTMFLSMLWFCYFGGGLSMGAINQYNVMVPGVKAFVALFLIIFWISWIWQLVRYSGFPRKRYWGFVIFGTVQGFICIVIAAIAFTAKLAVSQTGNVHFFDYSGMIGVFALSFYVAMVLAGIIGLRVFRREVEPSRETPV